MLLPSLASAKLAGKKAVCLSNLRQIGIALEMYAGEGDGRIPFGPTAPPFTSPAELYPSTGSPTSLLSCAVAPRSGSGSSSIHTSPAPRVSSSVPAAINW